MAEDRQDAPTPGGRARTVDPHQPPEVAGLEAEHPDLVRTWHGHGIMRDGVLHLPANVTWPANWPGRTRLGSQMAYLLTGLPVSIVTFLVVLVGLLLGAATAVAWIGLPITVGTLAAARGFARLERRATEAVTGRPLPPHHYRPAHGRGMVRLLREPGRPAVLAGPRARDGRAAGAGGVRAGRARLGRGRARWPALRVLAVVAAARRRQLDAVLVDHRRALDAR